MTVSSNPFLLIVEDDTSTLASLERILEPYYNVICCTNAEDALHQLDQNNISLVLSDYLLPNMSGLDFLKLVKIRQPTIIRILLTGVIEANELVSAMNENTIHRVFRKPIDHDFLLLQITEALLHHKLLGEKTSYEKLSVTDPVTGLYNHRYFNNYLSIEIERAQRHSRIISLIMIDIDMFKKYNDTKGHPEGDKLLQGVSQILQESIRSIDLAFRYAGDEFAIILPDTGQDRAVEIAERIRKKAESKNTGTTLSLGIASFPKHANSVQDLIQKADQALYLAKGRGKNQTVIAD